MTGLGPDEAKEARRANQLYWDGEESVNAVAKILGVSKGRLYELVAPLPSEIPCPDCGAELAFPNRTARDRGMVTCEVCGFEGDRDDLVGPDSDPELPTWAGSEGGDRGRSPFFSDTAGGSGAPGTATIVGGLLMGVVGGVLLVRWLRS